MRLRRALLRVALLAWVGVLASNVHGGMAAARKPVAAQQPVEIQQPLAAQQQMEAAGQHLSSPMEGASPPWTVRVGPVVEVSRLEWRVGFAGDGAASELRYSDIQTVGSEVEVLARALTRGPASLHLHSSVGAGRVRSGQARDSDWDTHGLEYSRSLSQVGGDWATSVSIGVKGDLRIGGPTLLDHAFVRAGYGRHETNLRKRDGQQLVPSGAPDDFLDGLDSRYRAIWTGLLAEAGLGGTLGQGRITASVGGMPKGDFRAHGRWNLRDDLAQPLSFRQTGEPAVLTGRVRYQREVRERWRIDADVGYTRRNVARGRDEVYLADGGVRTGALDSLDQRSWTVRLRVARDF